MIDDQSYVKLSCSKTKVVPFKKRPTAQLELCATLLLAKYLSRCIILCCIAKASATNVVLIGDKLQIP